MTVSVDNLEKKGRNADSLLSVLEKFHKDFKKSTADSLRINKARNEREIDVKKRETLGTVSNTSISNVTNISNTSRDRSGASVTSVIIPEKRVDNKEVISELKGISKNIITSSEKDTKKSKTIFKNSILQARILEGGFNYVKDFFFGGASDTDRIVNAVNNVEQAILEEDKIILDERSKFQKIAEKLPDEDIVKQVSKTIPTAGTVSEKIFKAVSSNIGDIPVGDIPVGEKVRQPVSPKVSSVKGEKVKQTVSSAVEGSKDIIGRFMDVISNALSSSAKDPKVKKSAEKGSDNIASMFVDTLDKGITKVLGASLLNKKTGFLGAVALFGSSADFGLSTAILNPLKTLKIGYKTFKVALGALVDRPLLQGIALSATTFGTLGAALSTVLLPLAKIIRPLTKELPSLGDAFTATRSKIAEAFKGTKEFLSKSTSTMLNKFKKSMGKKFLIAGVFMGAMGAKMLGIMGTVMVAASALWAGIVAVAIAAWPFIVGGLIIAAVVGIGYYIYKNWDKVKAKWHEYIVQPVIDFMFTAVDKFKTLKEKITGAISGFFDSILSGARTAIEMLPFGDKIANKVFGEKKTETEDKSVVTPVANELTPTIISSVKDRPAPTVISKDSSQVMKGKTEIIRDKTIIKENNEDNKKLMKNLDKTLKELSVNVNRQQQPITPIPQSNVDDLGTLLVTMG